MSTSHQIASPLPAVFFAYPSDPASCGDAIWKACGKLNASRAVNAISWEDLRIGGRVLIATICEKIAASDVIVCDFTSLNPNVLFEFGYALALRKRIWVIHDTSVTDSLHKLRKLPFLSTIGFVSYSNSEDIKRAFFKDSPHLDLEATLYRDCVEQHLGNAATHSIFYARSRITNETTIRLDDVIGRSPYKIIDDPDEGSSKSLAEYASLVWSTNYVLCHLASPKRTNSDIDHARQSLVAGLAHGWQRPLLILVEGDQLSPADYRDLAANYKTSDEAIRFFGKWYSFNQDEVPEKVRTQRATQLKKDLSALNLGGYVAEEEETGLVQKYFVETASYRDAIHGKNTIFVGRKGSGKTANFLKLKNDLSTQRRNIVVAIKPISYEIATVLAMMQALSSAGVRGHVLENLWAFLVYTEIARVIQERIATREPVTHSAAEFRFLKFCGEHKDLINDGFAIRLEKIVAALNRQLAAGGKDVNSQASRERLSELLHASFISGLKKGLKEVLHAEWRVYVLIDNLDKAWDKSAEIKEVAPLLLSLFAIVNNMRRHFTSEIESGRIDSFSMAVFVRADIISYVMQGAREPDKIPCYYIRWDDPQLLSRVVEERYIAAFGDSDGSGLWAKYFCPKVQGVSCKEYLLSVVHPRPRDLILFVNKAVEFAVNRRHLCVDQEDVLSAEYEYSRFAFDALVVESGAAIPQLEPLLFEFAGGPAVVSKTELARFITNANISADVESIVSQLVVLGAIGIETDRGAFWFSESPAELDVKMRIARRYSEGREPRYLLRRALHAYLEVKADRANAN